MPRDLDAMQLVVRGTAFHDWLSIDIDSDVMTPADAFTVQAALPDPRYLALFREGNACDVYLGDDRQMAGVVDEVELAQGEGSPEARMTLTGRDKGAFLVDSEAATIKASRYTVKTLAEKLLKPEWGIRRVILSNEDNRKLLLGKKDRKSTKGRHRWSSRGGIGGAREKVKVDPGQRVAQILDTQTRRLGLAWWLSAEGDLFIGRPDYDQTPAFEFNVYAPGSADARHNNVLGWSLRRSIEGRYSRISVGGQGLTPSGSMWERKGKKAAKYKGAAEDPDLVARGIKRELILVDSDILSSSEAQKRAEWEQGQRRLRGLALQLTVPGFRQDGRLFTVDTLARVRIEQAGIDGIFYVSQRRFTEDRERRRTTLTLHEKGVWLP